MSIQKTPEGWLMLLYSLPAKKASSRVNLWRKLKKMGALALNRSGHVLPDAPTHFERFQWLAQQVRDDGGNATLAKVSGIEGLTSDALAGLFNEARSDDYAALVEPLNALIAAHRKRLGEGFSEAVEKLRRQFQEARAIDYFDCPAAHDVEMLFQRASNLAKPRATPGSVLDPSRYQGRKWLTRPRPEIDRTGSAWLIRKYIDPSGAFVFAPSPSTHPEATPYDMMDVEFSHHGDDCTFETLLKRFAITDPIARRMGEMVHDADFEDGKFQRPECFGLDLLFKGWARLGLSDAKILKHGFECFDALYEILSCHSRSPTASQEMKDKHD